MAEDGTIPMTTCGAVSIVALIAGAIAVYLYLKRDTYSPPEYDGINWFQ